MIVGGEKFVYASYAVTWTGLILYWVSLIKRFKNHRNDVSPDVKDKSL